MIHTFRNLLQNFLLIISFRMKNTNRKIIIILKIITKIKYFKTYIIPNFILQKWCYINPNNTMTLIHGIKINKMLY